MVETEYGQVRVSLIFAMGAKGEIGLNGKLPWHIPQDLLNFKQITDTCPMIMGRKTWESFGGRPLPGRPHIVISSQEPTNQVAGVDFVKDLDTALAKALERTIQMGVEEIFVIGGAKVLEEALSHADRLYVTDVHGEFEADTFLNLAEFTPYFDKGTIAFRKYFRDLEGNVPPFDLSVWDMPQEEKP